MNTGRLYRLVAFGVVMSALACASNQFGRAFDSHRWSDAATALNADASLLNDENTLFQAAMLYSFPNRATYDPVRARSLFERLLTEHPAAPMRQTAVDQLSLLYELQRVTDASTVRVQALQSRIVMLEGDTVRLHASIDSIASRLRAEQDQSAVLRKVTARLESDLQDRESQLSALHYELNHLKAIDLHPALRAEGGDTALTKPKKP